MFYVFIGNGNGDNWEISCDAARENGFLGRRGKREEYVHAEERESVSLLSFVATPPRRPISESARCSLHRKGYSGVGTIETYIQEEFPK